jgi:hypothetical protein
MTYKVTRHIGGIFAMPLFLFSVALNASDMGFWGEVWRAAKSHPEFSSFKAANDAAAVNLEIEKSRRYPVISGVLARQDGESSLVNTPSAWQTGLQLKYSLYDNYRQDARDEIAESEGRFEQLTAAERLEQIMSDLAFAYLDMWHADAVQTEIDQAYNRVESLLNKMKDQRVKAEFSAIDRAPLEQYLLELESLQLDMAMLKQRAQNQWLLSGAGLPSETYFPALPHIEKADNASLARLRHEVAIEAGRQRLAEQEEGLSIDLSASHLWRQYDGAGSLSNHTIWSVSANMPLFDGGVQQSIIKRHTLRKAAKESALYVAKAQNDNELATLQQWLANKEQLNQNARAQCQKLASDLQQLEQLFSKSRAQLEDVFAASRLADQCQIGLLSKELEKWQGVVRMAALSGGMMAYIEEEL